MQKYVNLSVILMAGSGLAWGAESRVTGQLQVQGAYLEPALDGEGRWYLQAPNSWLGLEVLESVTGSQYRAVLEVDLDPLSVDEPVSSRQMFIEWLQPLYSIRGGQLRSLEQRLLADPINHMHGFDGGQSTPSDRFSNALAIDNYSVRNALGLEQPSIEFTASNGELMYVSGQWTFEDEAASSSLQQWAVAAGLDTPEGSVALTYRRNDDFDAGLFGSSILWQSDGLQLGGSALYREDVVAWDVVGAYQAGTVVSKLSYGRDNPQDASDEARYWAFGIDQVFSESILNYSEIRWQPEPEQWRWMTGFRLTF
ncbi:hypothetical protein [Saccharospirillum impatiens]|uniref:hypothetical protein n=1 Tax=Saccharospirillum impatiens TaxID=169438 RepID=UPI00042655BF|nr:hypothetical protein [Saccharospirillum impatiens]